MRKKSIISVLSMVLASVIVLFSFPITAGASDVVTDLQIEPISVIEGTNGYTDYNENIFRYTLEDKFNYTVTFADGEVVSGEGYMFNHNGVHYNFEIETDQSETNQWTKGNTYAATVSIGGKSVEVPVTIEETPIENIYVEPISFIEHCGGVMVEYYEDQFYYYRVRERLMGTVTFKDGTTVDLADTVEYNGEDYWYSLTDNQSYGNQWKVGNTYIEQLELMGVQVDVPVTIKEIPIQSIEVEPMQIIENTNGMFYEGENGCFYVYDVSEALKVKATLDNGEVVESYGGMPLEIEGERVDIAFSADHLEDNIWTVGNTYEIEVIVGNHTAKTTIEILPTEVQSVEVKPVRIFENTMCGYGNYNDESGNIVDYTYYFMDDVIEYTVTYKNGEVVSGFGTSGDVNIDILDDQSYDNQWTVGNTYTVVAYFDGYKTTFDVTIVENPVESVVLDPITIKEGTNCEVYEDSNGELFIYYYPEECASYTINFKDGTSMHVDGDTLTYDSVEYPIYADTDQDEDNRWTAGNTYTYTINVMGFETQGEVTIEKS